MANEIGNAKVKVELDFAQFERDIAKVRASLRSLTSEKTEVRLGFDTDPTKLKAELEKLRAQIKRFDPEVEVGVKVSKSASVQPLLADLKRKIAAERIELGEAIRLSNSDDVKNQLRLLAAEAKRILNDIPLDVDVDGIAVAEARLDALSRNRTAEIKVDVDKGGGGLSSLTNLLRIQQGLGPLALSGSVGSIGSAAAGSGGIGLAIAAPLAVAAAAAATAAGIAASFGIVGKAATDAAVKITEFAIDSAAALEVPLRSLARVTGDQFEQIGADVIDFARTTPFTVESAVRATQRVIAGIGVQPAEAVGFVKTIADAVAVGGGSTANFENIVTALTKFEGRGKLQQREITQLIRNTGGLFNQGELIQNLAEDLDIGPAEVLDRISRGAITSKESMDAVLRTLEEIPGATGAAARATDTLSGAITNLQDNLQVASLLGFRDFLDSAKNALTGDPEAGIGGISDALANQFALIGPAVGRAFDDIGPRIAPAINKIGPLIANVVDSIGPSLAAVVDAIGDVALGFSIGFGQGEFGGLPDLIRKIGTALSLVGTVGRPVFNSLIEGFEAVAHAVQLVTGIITIQFTSAFKAITEIVSGGLSLAADVTGAISSIPGANKLFDFGDAEKQLNSASRGINRFGDKVSQFSTGSFRSGIEGLKDDFGGIADNIEIAGRNALLFTNLVGSGFGEETQVFDVDRIKASLEQFAQTEEAGTVAGQNYVRNMSEAIANSSGELSTEELTATIDQAITDTVEAFRVATPAAAELGAEIGKIGPTAEGSFVTAEDAVNSYIANILLAAKQQQVVNLLLAGGFDDFAAAIKEAPVESINTVIAELEKLGPAGIAAKEQLIDSAQEGAAAIDGVTEAIVTAQTFAAAGINTNVTATGLTELESQLSLLQQDRATLVRVGGDTSEINAQIARLVADINSKRATIKVGVSAAYTDAETRRLLTAAQVTRGRRLGGGIDPGQFSWVGEGGRELLYTGTTAASIINNQTSERIASMLGLGNQTAAAPGTTAITPASINPTIATTSRASLQLTNQQAKLIGKAFAQTVGGVTAVIAPNYSDPDAIASKVRYASKASQHP